MKRQATLLALALMLLATACQNQRIDYSKALFKHVPEDPELLILARPNEVMDFSNKTLAELGLTELFDQTWNANLGDLEQYRRTAVEVIEALGIPWQDIRVVGVLVYFKKPVFLASGEIKRDQVEAKLKELGFNQNRNGTFDYVYDKQKLFLPDDGLIMMAEEDLIEFLMDVPDENRLWNRADFAEYRTRSPLDNTIFVWSDPPEYLLSGFEHREDLGSVSLAVDLKSAISIKNTLRVKDPNKTMMLYNFLTGAVHIGRGAFSNHDVYGPVFNGIQVTHDNHVVETSLVVPASQVPELRQQLAKDMGNPSDTTFKGFQQFFKAFQ